MGHVNWENRHAWMGRILSKATLPNEEVWPLKSISERFEQCRQKELKAWLDYLKWFRWDQIHSLNSWLCLTISQNGSYVTFTTSLSKGHFLNGSVCYQQSKVEETSIGRLFVYSLVHSCQNHEYPLQNFWPHLFVACVSKWDQVVVDLRSRHTESLFWQGPKFIQR